MRTPCITHAENTPIDRPKLWQLYDSLFSDIEFTVLISRYNSPCDSINRETDRPTDLLATSGSELSGGHAPLHGFLTNLSVLHRICCGVTRDPIGLRCQHK